ncbi:peptidase S8 [Oceanobacillus zhaokaii]|uniref:Peptidase S8 n=1 Tax=Oceanobacillus zhaokaii TaxID=2052660 RepID=A0A345PJT2_9BACI|nr:S8 family serine peptidase [Oceanobacillus zhaokaii]AXI10262.1 peptidase S8 [Oceanobacillus zhaokaii]
MQKNRRLTNQVFGIFLSFLMIFSMLSPGLASAQSNERAYSSVKDSEEVAEEKVSASLSKAFDAKDSVTFLIKFKEKSDSIQVAKDAKAKAEKTKLSSYKQEYAQRSAVISELKATAQQSQGNVKQYLEQEVEKGNAKDVESFHIVNGMAVTATKEVAEKLATFPEVEKIIPNEQIQLNTKVEKGEAIPQSTIEDVEWNVERVGAPDVWERGIDGSGVVVAVIDSGVDWNHPALKEKYRGYNPNTKQVEHTYSWFDAYAGKTTPYDDNSHGTHVAGTIVGGEPNGENQIGVAPGAQWIGVKILGADGKGWSTDILRGAQWTLAPGGDPDKAPDIVNNSWGGGPGINEWFREMVINWRAAGIFPEFSAGNDGSGAGTIGVPGNYPESFATGATDFYDDLAVFSSRGPSPYPGEVKPDISAPGQNIRSAMPGGGYGGKSGTSMAGPAVSGVIALLLSADSSLTVDEVEQTLIETAIPLTNWQYSQTPNNGFGYGLVDAKAAVASVIGEEGKIEGQVTTKEGSPISAEVSVLETGRSVMTNPDTGSYTLPHNSGTYTVLAEAYGFNAQEKSVAIGETGTVKADFTLVENPKATLSGKVTDQRTGEAIEGATLIFLEDANIAPIVSDRNGNYSLTAYVGSYTLKVMAEGYHGQEIAVTLTKDLSQNITLKPFYTIPSGEIYYDDGTAEDASAYYYPDNGWAVKMSLPEGRDSGIVTDGVFKFYNSNWPFPGGTAFQVEVWDASGPNGMPGEKLAGPIEAEAIRDLNKWTVVNLRDYNIQVEGDFYMVYIQSNVDYLSPGLAFDGTSQFSGRNYSYHSGEFESSPAEDGNIMIRARVAHEVDAPVITSPQAGLLTNKSAVNVEGTASPKTSVQLLNNGELVETIKVSDNGTFAISTELTEGGNELIAVSTINGEEGIESTPVNVTLDSQAPTLTIDSPKNGIETSQGTVTVEGTVADKHLDFVEVNGAKATITKNKYNKQIELKSGKNEIKVIAADKLGNKQSETISVISDQTAPTIGKLEPSKNQTVFPGDKVEVSFESNKKGGKASFEVKLPKDAPKITMEEVTPGNYKGTWTVPAKLNLDNVSIQVNITDKAGNITAQETAGKLNIVSEKMDRISGYSRYDTAIEISKKGWSRANTVILSRGDNFADALAGVPLAHKLDAPILMTPGNKLWDNTMKEINRLGAKNVVILGGEVAVSKAVSDKLEKSGLKVRRISGHSRYDTAAVIAAEVAPKGTGKVVVANGTDFPDALSVASHAAKEGLPILLTQSNKLPDATKNKIKQLGAKQTIVVGGEIAVSKKVEAQLPKTTRLSGRSRYDTNIAISEHFGVASKHLYVATGKNYADALTGAVLAAKNDSTILLVHNAVPGSTASYITKQGTSQISIFGGEIAISKDVASKLEKLIK